MFKTNSGKEIGQKLDNDDCSELQMGKCTAQEEAWLETLTYMGNFIKLSIIFSLCS